MLFQITARLRTEYTRSNNTTLASHWPPCVYLLYYSSAVMRVLQFEFLQIRELKFDTYAILKFPVNRFFRNFSMSCF